MLNTRQPMMTLSMLWVNIVVILVVLRWLISN